MKAVASLFLSLSFAFALTADLKETRTLSLPAENIELLEIDCGGGYLKIKGDKQSDEIKVKAEIYVNVVDMNDFKKIVKEQLQLKLSKDGNKAVLLANFGKSSSFFSGFLSSGVDKRINLFIEIPEPLNLLIDDGSGDIAINNAKGNISIDDGSGSIEVLSAGGKIKIDDGSGDIEVRNIGGDVYIDDRSGEILCDGIDGDCNIDDNSGNIIVKNVGSDVTIENGNGSIEIDTVNGDVIIKDNGSGRVVITGVKGRVYRHDEE